MCRMMAVHAPTLKQAQELVDGFRLQATQSRPDPEDGVKTHQDGWGLVAFAPDEVRYLARRPADASTDAFWDKAVQAMRHAPKGAAFLAHLRRASSGQAALENTHPFVADGWAFAHNGTVYGIQPDPTMRYGGATDSERFFRKLLKHRRAQPTFEDALKRCIQEIEGQGTYTSLTFLMTDGQTLYGYVRVGQDPKGNRSRERMQQYYTLGWGRRGKTLVVAQEPTHLGSFDAWHEVPEDGLLVWRRGNDPEIQPLGLAPAATMG